MSELISSRQDIIKQIRPIGPISINCADLQAGNDNYHVDIRLSDAFVGQARKIIKEIVYLAIAESRVVSGGKDDLVNYRNAYWDMMETTLHRVKADLNPETIHFLQFGVIKFILSEVLEELNSSVKLLEEKIGQQQFAGSRDLIPTQEKFASLRRHYDEYRFRSTRAALQPLQREENTRMRELRRQLLPCAFPELQNILFNPMLSAASPHDLKMMVEIYSLWPKGGKGFSEANQTLEEMLAKRIPELEISPLKFDGQLESDQVEPYDTFNAFFLSRDLLGLCENQNGKIREDIGWLEQPANIRLLFDNNVHGRSIDEVKKVQGFRSTSRFKSDVKKLLKTAIDIRKSMFTDCELKEAIAGLALREKWSTKDQDILELPIACAYIAGKDRKKILTRIDQSKESAVAFIHRLDALVEEVSRQFKKEIEEKFLRMLTDFSRYRMHLKYYRFAHRVFNRLNVVLEPQKIELARSSGNLYELLGNKEIKVAETTEPEIIHHVILKARVRGSTEIIQMLVSKNLNPASYFSFRLFDPINGLLAKYKAIKVFNEGDAITLSIYENSDQPQHWYSVSRACGMAKEILDVVGTKNVDSAQAGLPELELCIGISYAANKPQFLFDEKRPIMISSAIGDAARLSFCSAKSKKAPGQGLFNVDAYVSGEDMARTYFNVNGILLSNESFKKLRDEISLRQLKVKCGNSSETMLVGSYPDINGKQRNLVIRKGTVKTWSQDKWINASCDQFFYEVMTNSKFASQIVDLSRKQKQ